MSVVPPADLQRGADWTWSDGVLNEWVHLHRSRRSHYCELRGDPLIGCQLSPGGKCHKDNTIDRERTGYVATTLKL